jgi:hypothetical protein
VTIVDGDKRRIEDELARMQPSSAGRVQWDRRITSGGCAGNASQDRLFQPMPLASCR